MPGPFAQFSGARPAENGDFSGVAKNSYYIEKGKVQFPVSETMVSGNLAELVKKGKITYEMGLERSHHPEEYNRLVGKG